MPFEEARRQALVWLDHLKREVKGAQIGQELAFSYGIERRIAGLLTQLGLRETPITRQSDLVGADGRPIPDDAELTQGATLELRHWVSVAGPMEGDYRSSRYRGQKGPRQDGQPGVERTRGGADDDSFRANLLRALERWRTYIECMSPPTAETLALAVNDWRDVIEAAKQYRLLLAAFQVDAATHGDAEADTRTEQAQSAYTRLMDGMKRFDRPAQPPIETAGLCPGAKYVNDDGTPRPFKLLLADALVRINADILTLKDCLTEAETLARQNAIYPSILPTNGAAGTEDLAKTQDSGHKLFVPSLVWAILFVAITAAVVYCAWLWGQGDNLWQKILASWPYLAVGLAVCLGGFLLHSGKAGRQLLKRWKGEE